MIAETMAASSGAAAGATDPRSAAGQPFVSIHAVRVFVRDLERSLRFYVDQLGFRLAIDARLQDGERWVAVSPPDGTAVLTLAAPAARRRGSER